MQTKLGINIVVILLMSEIEAKKIMDLLITCTTSLSELENGIRQVMKKNNKKMY
jgi:hypothetical protein